MKCFAASITLQIQFLNPMLASTTSSTVRIITNYCAFVWKIRIMHRTSGGSLKIQSGSWCTAHYVAVSVLLMACKFKLPGGAVSLLHAGGWEVQIGNSNLQQEWVLLLLAFRLYSSLSLHRNKASVLSCTSCSFFASGPLIICPPLQQHEILTDFINTGTRVEKIGPINSLPRANRTTVQH